MIKVLIFEDIENFADSYREMLMDVPDMQLVGLFPTAKNAAKYVSTLRPDVVLMDIDMPEVNGLDGLRQIRNSGYSECILMQTVFDDNERIFRAICDGASGYILKKTPPEKILDYIREGVNGGAPMTPSVARQVLEIFAKPYSRRKEMELLTPRELDVLRLLVKGYSYKMIAYELEIALETIRSHIKKIYEKLQVNSKSEAVARALQNQIN